MTTAASLQPTDFAQYPPLARQFAEQHIATLRTLPLLFASALLREIVGYDWQFPAEREELAEQFHLLSTSSDLQQAAQQFATIELLPELTSIPWAAQPDRFSEKLTAYLWATHRIDAFRAIATAYGDKLSTLRTPAASATPRLCIVLVGRDAPATQLPLFGKLRSHGTYFSAVDATSAVQAAADALHSRATSEPAPYSHWHIDGGEASSVSGVSTVSYVALAPMRSKLLEMMHNARTSGSVGPEDLRSQMAQMRLEQFGVLSHDEDQVLRRFELRLLSEGSGTQIFSTTFVQWAARETLRRVRPRTLVLRYAPRQVEQPMNDLVIAAKSKEVVDPAGSLVDADMGAYYTWLNLQRLSGADASRFVVCHENGHEAIAIAPAMAVGSVSTQRCDLAQILRWIV